ncbi:MAG: DUF1722 domain-containing protein [Pseudomonadales bacterium]|nr:MAG: DUF1722 domain-containing protein [Pseudomonadales bacterium]
MISDTQARQHGGSNSGPRHKIPIGISSCLLGERVRFDGGHKRNSYILDTLGQYFAYRAYCPEMAIGLGVPRETIRLVDVDGAIRVRGSKNESLDVSEQLEQAAHSQAHWHREICGYIVKKDSPSCGMERVKVYTAGHVERRGSGAYTRVLMDNFPDLPVEEEGRLGDAALRENFVQRVFIFRRWREMLGAEFGWRELTEFHARHKYILYSHDQELTRELGRELADAHKQPLLDYAPKYLSSLMKILKITATRKNHVNTLQHIRGYLKTELDGEDKRELSESIENYRLGLLPLIVPITLLRHHFRRNPDPYIEQSWYLRPHPDELMLLNTL